jgi:hypothetical protein
MFSDLRGPSCLLRVRRGGLRETPSLKSELFLKNETFSLKSEI